jgi:hypothetical protein
VATLQPLHGSVVQPYEGGEFRIEGSPLGDCEFEASRLPELQKVLLTKCYRLGRLKNPMHEYKCRPGELQRTFEEMMLNPASF